MSASAPISEILGSLLEKRKQNDAERRKRERRRLLAEDDPETAKPWNRNRAAADCVAEMFFDADDERLERQAQGMRFCSGSVLFRKERETGRFKLVSVDLCRARFCPLCQWRKSLKLKARFLEALPRITEENPKARWLMLTLTVRNCPLDDLSATITAMNKAWTRLLRKDELKPVLGWTRAMEITKPQDSTTAHPHFHCLLLVSSTYFNANYYIKQERWTELWKDCARLDYTPVVHVTAVKPRGRDQTEQEAVGAAAAEALKYALKPSDMTTDADWTRAVAKISHGRRFLGTGGVLKGILADQDEELEQVAAEDEAKPAEQEEPAKLIHHVAYDWASDAKRYERAPEKDEVFSPAEAKTLAKARAVAALSRAKTAKQFVAAMDKIAKVSKKRGRPKRAAGGTPSAGGEAPQKNPPDD